MSEAPAPDSSSMSARLRSWFSGPVVLWLANAAIVAYTVSFVYCLFVGDDVVGPWRRAFFAAFLTYLIDVWRDCGVPNNLNPEYWSRLLMHPSSSYIMFGFIFMPYTPMPLALGVIAAYAFYRLCHGSIIFTEPWQHNGLVVRIRSICFTVARNDALVQQLTARIELFLLPMLLLTGGLAITNLVRVYLYWGFLKLRYRISGYTRAQVDTAVATLDGLAHRLPSPVSGLYHRVRSFLSG